MFVDPMFRGVYHGSTKHRGLLPLDHYIDTPIIHCIKLDTVVFYYQINCCITNKLIMHILLLVLLS